jgi:hypothetical protein
VRPEGRPALLDLDLVEPTRLQKVHLVVRPLDGSLVRARVLGQDQNGSWLPLASGGGRDEILCNERREYRLSPETPKLSRIRVELQGEGNSFRVALHEIWVEPEGGPLS